jgi:hypothetical protein
LTQTPVKTINIFNKAYVPVSERIRLVHELGREFEMLESEPRHVGDKWIWRCVIKLDGKQFIGNAEIKLQAKAGSPDATDPWACGETSAVGRALAFAGILVEDSIASADEVVGAAQQRPEPAATGRSNGGSKPAQMPENRARLKTLFDEAMSKGICTDRDEFATWCSSVLVSETLLTPPDLLHLSHEELLKIGAFISSEPGKEEVAA